MTDLLVSVHGEQIILRSARLGRRVVPRLTSAHNFEMSQGIYRFSVRCSRRGPPADLAWDWGPLRDAPFLPRVVCGRLVLSRATWQVGEDEWKPLGQAQGAMRFRLVQSWRHARRLPRWIALAEADNELPIDLDNVLAVDTLVELVKGQKRSHTGRVVPRPGRNFAPRPRRPIRARIGGAVGAPGATRPVHLTGRRDVRRRLRASTRVPHLSSSPRCRRRSFPPGSEWLFAKLYSGPATADQVLRDVVRPVVERVLSAGAADRWFFIRYGDPDWHLRLRFHGHPARLGGEVLPALQAAAAPCSTTGGCGGSSWTPMSARSSGTAAQRALCWPSGSSRRTAKRCWPWPNCSPRTPGAICAGVCALVGMDLLLERSGFRPGGSACRDPDRRGTRLRPSSTRTPSSRGNWRPSSGRSARAWRRCSTRLPIADASAGRRAGDPAAPLAVIGARDGRAGGLRAGRDGCPCRWPTWRRAICTCTPTVCCVRPTARRNSSCMISSPVCISRRRRERNARRATGTSWRCA